MSGVNFYEFNKHDYYGLIGAFNLEQAFEIYHDYIAGESVEQVREEGLPDEITYEAAFNKFEDVYVRGGIEDESFIIEQFGDGNGLLLVDESLL